MLAGACDGVDEEDGAFAQEDIEDRSAATACTPTAPTASATSGSKTYQFFPKSQTTWSAAKSFCASIGGQLANPTSDAENTAVQGLLTGERTFLGPYQSSGQATPGAGWKTIDGSTIAYTHWGDGQPSDANNVEINKQNCSAMDPSTGLWDDVSCSNTQGYDWVCEFTTAPVTCGGAATCSIAADSTTYACACPTGSEYDSGLGECVDIAVTGLSPAFGNYDLSRTVTITGKGFDSGTTATVAGTSVTVTYVSANKITLKVPAATNAGTASIVVTDSDGNAASTSFAYTMAASGWSGTIAANTWTTLWDDNLYAVSPAGTNLVPLTEDLKLEVYVSTIGGSASIRMANKFIGGLGAEWVASCYFKNGVCDSMWFSLIAQASKIEIWATLYTNTDGSIDLSLHNGTRSYSGSVTTVAPYRARLID